MPYLGFSAKNDITINATSDLDLTSDNTTIKFGADDDVTITHDPDDGLIFKSIATADDNPFLLTIQTGETDLAANDVIGKIQFQAPDEGTGTDANLVSAAIQAVAEGDFSSSSNATSLQFMTGSSEAATTKMTILSSGNVEISNGLDVGTITTSTLASLRLKTAGSNNAVALNIEENSGNEGWGLGVNANGDLKFYNSGTGTSTGNSAVTFSDDDKVGIGTASPSDDLHIASSVATIRLEDNDVANGEAYSKIFTHSHGGIEFSADPDGNRSSTDIRFTVDGSETARIDSSGNFGIGDTSPSNRLSVVAADGDADNAYVATFQNQEATDDRNFGVLIKAGSTATDSSLVVTDHDASNNLFFVKGNGNAFIGGSVAIGTSSANYDVQVHQSDSTNSIIQFTNSTTGTTSNDGLLVGINSSEQAQVFNRENTDLLFATNNSERMRLDSNGRVGIGKTPDSSLGSFLQIEANDGISLGRSGQSNHFIIRPNASTDGLRFTQAGTGDRVTIDSSGNVLVGTTSLTTGTLGSSNTFLELSAGTNNGSGSLILSRNTTTDNDEVGGIRFANQNNADDDGLDADGKMIAAISARLETSDSNSGDDSGGHLTFNTKPEAGNFAERMRIDSSGDLNIVNTGQASLNFTTDGSTDYAQILGGKSGSGIGDLRFSVYSGGLSEAMRIDSSGRLLLGTTSTTLYDATSGGGILAVPNSSTTIARQSSGSTQPLLILNETGVDGTLQEFRKDGSTVGIIGTTGGDVTIGTGDTMLRFQDGDDCIVPRGTDSAVRDNAIDLGIGSQRFDDIFATNGTIQTSDENEKQDIASATDKELSVAKKLSTLFKTFRWRDKVVEKGDKARTPTGIVAQ